MWILFVLKDKMLGYLTAVGSNFACLLYFCSLTDKLSINKLNNLRVHKHKQFSNKQQILQILSIDDRNTKSNWPEVCRVLKLLHTDCRSAVCLFLSSHFTLINLFYIQTVWQWRRHSSCRHPIKLFISKFNFLFFTRNKIRILIIFNRHKINESQSSVSFWLRSLLLLRPPSFLS